MVDSYKELREKALKHLNMLLVKDGFEAVFKRALVSRQWDIEEPQRVSEHLVDIASGVKEKEKQQDSIYEAAKIVITARNHFRKKNPDDKTGLEEFNSILGWVCVSGLNPEKLKTLRQEVIPGETHHVLNIRADQEKFSLLVTELYLAFQNKRQAKFRIYEDVPLDGDDIEEGNLPNIYASSCVARIGVIEGGTVEYAFERIFEVLWNQYDHKGLENFDLLTQDDKCKKVNDFIDIDSDEGDFFQCLLEIVNEGEPSYLIDYKSDEDKTSGNLKDLFNKYLSNLHIHVIRLRADVDSNTEWDFINEFAHALDFFFMGEDREPYNPNKKIIDIKEKTTSDNFPEKTVKSGVPPTGIEEEKTENALSGKNDVSKQSWVQKIISFFKGK